jgi:hypothetical protein
MVKIQVDGLVCKDAHEGVGVDHPVTGAEQSPQAKSAQRNDIIGRG